MELSTLKGTDDLSRKIPAADEYFTLHNAKNSNSIKLPDEKLMGQKLINISPSYPKVYFIKEIFCMSVEIFQFDSLWVISNHIYILEKLLLQKALVSYFCI